MSQRLKFPEGFLWGAATSAHQVEGNNAHSDWWAWERSARRHNQLMEKGKDPKDYESGVACDSYNRFDEDFSLAQHLHHNATRLSIEWARIEPKEGEFNEQAFEHYEKVLQSAKSHGLSTFVTLHHFTNPLWFSKKGAFGDVENILYFVRYAKKAVQRLDQYVDFWLVINEPEIMSSMPYNLGVYAKPRSDWFMSYWSARILCKTILTAIPELRKITAKPISIAYNIHDLEPAGFFFGRVAVAIHRSINRYILNHTAHLCDFIGLNYYFHHHVSLFGHRKHSKSHHIISDLGWGVHPDGLERVLLSLKPYNKPIYITENGLADAKDINREKFIKDHLFYLHRAIQDGVPVKGYLHWSLIDNFEWAEGFGPRFGLIEIDRDDLLRRKVRHSALTYAEICKNNYLEY